MCVPLEAVCMVIEDNLPPTEEYQSWGERYEYMYFLVRTPKQTLKVHGRESTLQT